MDQIQGFFTKGTRLKKNNKKSDKLMINLAKDQKKVKKLLK